MTDEKAESAQDVAATTEHADASSIPAPPLRKKPMPGGAQMFIALAMAAIGGMGAENLDAMEAYDADRARRQTPRHAPRQHPTLPHYRSPPPAPPSTDEHGHALDGTSRTKIGNDTIRAAREKREKRAAKRAAASKAPKGESS